MGIDNTNQVFKIAYGTSAVLGTNDRFLIATTGDVIIPGSLQIGSGGVPTYELDVNTGARLTNEIGFRVVNTSTEGIYIVPYAGAAGYNNNTALGDIVIAGTAGENLVIGAGGSNAGLRFINVANTITTVANFYLKGAAEKFGYDTGAGGTVIQSPNKSTGVTLNRPTGQITMSSALLGASTTVSFTLTNSVIAAGDIVLVQNQATGTLGSYNIEARSAAGSATIAVRNITTGSLSQAIVISFAVIKAVTS
jgi:hypothetical protein